MTAPARRFSLRAVAAVLLFASLQGGEAAALPRIINSHPLFLGTGTPVMTSAQPENAFSVTVAYSSTYLAGAAGAWQADIDLETFVTELMVSRLVSASTEVSISVPVISHNSGVLDGALETYHDAFGFPDYGRSERPKNDFLFRIAHNGRTVIEGEPGELVLGDIRAAVKQPVFGRDPFVSLFAYVELPTGNAEGGYGNGSVDWGMMVLAHKALSGTLGAHLNAGYVIPGDYRAEERIPLRDYLFAGLALEWDYSPSLSAFVMVSVQESPYATGIRELDEVGSVLSFAGEYRTGRSSSLELSFSEDLTTAGAPDFMVSLAFRQAW